MKDNTESGKFGSVSAVEWERYIYLFLVKLDSFMDCEATRRFSTTVKQMFKKCITRKKTNEYVSGEIVVVEFPDEFALVHCRIHVQAGLWETFG
jgi:hypothetical protein